MNPHAWARVRYLFEQAIDRDPGEVDAWLAREAAGDPGVAAEVRSLLDHHARAGDFLASPVIARHPDLLGDEGLGAGARVGPYTIVRELGRGGMGRVYQARDERLGRTVALKALAPALTRDGHQRERLRREARAAASLTHPGICTVYALEEIGDEVFIAAEYVDGQTLREEMAEGRRPEAGALLATTRAMADALASAHACGIVHRDLKPENVMRSRGGRLKVLDFGLALVEASSPIDAGPRVTLPGAVLGTPAYMAPEQLNGGAGDARSDVFALGVLLFEYATGSHPFEAGTELARIARTLRGTPDKLQALRPDVPDALRTVIERCMQPDPADRFADAGALVGALEQPAPAASWGSRVEPPVATWWRRHQLAVIGLYLTAGSAAWLIKEWEHGIANQGFLVVGLAAMIAGIFRGHVLFIERMNRESFDAERRRAEKVTMASDLVMALTLAFVGWRASASRPVAGVLAMALAVGIAVTRLVIERATTAATFER